MLRLQPGPEREQPRRSCRLGLQAPGPPGGLLQVPFFPGMHWPVQPGPRFYTCVSLRLAKTCLITQMPVKVFYVKPSPTAQGQEGHHLLDTDGHRLLCLDGTSRLETLPGASCLAHLSYLVGEEDVGIDSEKYSCPPVPGPPGSWTQRYTYGDSQGNRVLASKRLSLINSGL